MIAKRSKEVTKNKKYYIYKEYIIDKNKKY